MRALFIVVRIAGAAAIIAAIVAQLMLSLQVWAEVPVKDVPNQTAHFFSFFTIDSNLLSVVSFLVGAVFLVLKRDDAAAWGVFRGSVTAYMATTGIVYNLLLRGIELPQGSTVPWSNEVLHVVAPVLVILDWFFAPGRRPLKWTTIWVVIAFPLVWTVYTMIRGPLVVDGVTGRDYWYPYPFLNPNTAPEGYFTVFLYMVLIAAIIGLVGAGAIWVSRKGGRWPLPAAAPTVPSPAAEGDARTTP
ncbi:Pr6Pr family membrane protein [Schumannella soli]|uniref:Pr6Pr family membrane protein n=1 Tax=Schumannella soli TaxID=2590779 RepID=UPI0015E847B0|nr:Pr6Pr family membrane protein [Schumannella soli]